MVAVEALLPAVLLLLVGILAIVLVRPIKLSPIVGYLIAGLIIGPHAWGLIEESKTTHLLAELGVVFLLFDIGLHFSLPRIWEARRDILGLGPLQVLVCGLAFGGIAVAMGFATEQAVILGGMLALSSTAVVVRAIAERRQQNCPVGRTSTAVLILQDIVAIYRWQLHDVLDGDDEHDMHQVATVAFLQPQLSTTVHLTTSPRERLIINPGSVGQPRDNDARAAYAILDLDAMTWRYERVAYPVELTQSQLQAAGLPKRLIDRLSFGW